MPSPPIVEMHLIGRGTEQREAKEASAHRAVSAQLQRFLENVKDYERAKQMKADLQISSAQRAAELESDPEKSLDIAKQLYRQGQGKLNQLLDAQRRALEVGFEQGAWELPDTVRPLPEQAERIAKNLPIKLNRMQALSFLLKEQDDVDKKVDVLANRLSPEQSSRLNELLTEQQWNPFAERNFIGRAVGALGAFGSGASAALTSLVGYGRELTKDVPLADIKLTKSLAEITAENKAAGKSHGFPFYEGKPEVPESAGPARVMGVPIAEAASRIISDPKNRETAIARMAAAYRAGFGDSEAVPVASESGQAMRVYEEKARDVVTRLLPEAHPAQQETAINFLRDRYVAQDAGSFAINHPHITQAAVEMATDPLTYVGLGPVIKAATKVSGLEALGKAVAKTPLAESVRTSTIPTAAAILKDKFTYMPALQRFRKLGAEGAEDFADMTEAVVAKSSWESRKRTKEAIDLLKVVRQGEDQALLFDLLELAPEQAEQLIVKHGLSDTMQAAHRAGRDLSKFLQGEMVETGLSRNWLRLSEEVRKPLSNLSRKEARQLAQALGSAAEGVDVGALPARVQAAYKAAQELPPALRNEFLRGHPLSNKFLAGQFLSDIRFKPGYVPHLISEGGEAMKQVAPMSYQARPRMLASGAYSRTGGTTPLRDAAKQFEAKLRDELPKARAASQVKNIVQEAEKHGFVMRAVPEKVDEYLEVLNKHQPGMEWVRIDAPGPRADKVLQALSGEAHVGLDEIVQRLAGPLGTARGAESVIVPREIFQTLSNLAPVIKTPTGIDDVMKAASRVIIPINTFWRYAQTIPNFAFSARNMISSVGLHTMSHGVGALSPEKMAKNIAASFMAASGNPTAIKALDHIPWRTLKGERTTMRWITQQAEELGLIQNMDEQVLETLGDLAQTAGGGKALDAIVNAPLKVADFVSGFGGAKLRGKWNPAFLASPKYLATATENYQRLMSFASFLEGTTPKDIAKAFRLANKAASNYAQVGEWEKGLIRHTLGFYGWNRFILPMMAKKLFTDTARVNAWARGIGGLQRWFGEDSPYSYKGEPSHINWGIHREQMNKRIPNIGSHEHAIGVIENPLSFGYAFLPAIAKSFGLNVKEGPETWQILGPLVHFGMEAIWGRDLITGEKLPSLFAPDELPSLVQNILWKTIERPVSQVADVVRLYSNDANRYDKALDLDLRYRVGRQLLGLDNIVARALGAEPRSMGGMFDPESGGIAGMFQYPANIIEQMARKQREASGKQLPMLIQQRRQALPAELYED